MENGSLVHDDRLPRHVVVTVRPCDPPPRWELEVDTGDLELCAARAYLAGALEIVDGQLDDDDEEDEGDN